MDSKNKLYGDAEMVRLTGELTVGCAAELKALLRKSLQGSSGQVRIQLEDLTAVDLSCLQLLCSAHRTASAMNRQLRLVGERPALFCQTMRAAGFTRQRGCGLTPNTDCLWSGGEK